MKMRSITACLILMFYAAVSPAQGPFSSGSTGADGPLTYAPNLGTVYFPPSGLAQRTNNIYNFTTITIGAGTTVRVSGWVINGPVYWLAQGDVTIGGTLDLSGQLGHAPGNVSYRAPSEPGAGGYSGGVAQLSTGQNATAGNGPGGGATPGNCPGIDPRFGCGGKFSGGSYLQPLIGGSGGGGACRPTDVGTGQCSGGGAGGGAILIASSTSITISSGGAINAQGGGTNNSYFGGGGSGGAVRLVSNTIMNSGTINISGGGSDDGYSNGGPGIVRFEGFTLNIGTVAGTALGSTPYNLALPVGGPPSVNVTSVNGISINANPFSFPDATITAGTSVPVIISGVNVPAGATGNLYIYSENAADQTIPFTLTGTLASTTATVNVPYPSGGSRGFAKAVWTSQ
jgi:hypothetical protein